MAKIKRSFSNHIYHNDLVSENDNVLLAVSGGVDSLVMAKLFRDYSHKSNLKIRVAAAYVDIKQVSIGPAKKAQLKSRLDRFGLDLKIIETGISAAEDYHCYICSKERRKQLFTYYDKNNFDAIAFGHHRDDLIETGFMNLIRHGNLNTLKSLDYMFDGVIKVIRPLLATPKKTILHYANQNQIEPLARDHCKYGANSKRAEIREYIRMISGNNEAFKENLYNAILDYNSREY